MTIAFIFILAAIAALVMGDVLAAWVRTRRKKRKAQGGRTRV